MNLLISPHDDDQNLFACFTLMREKPLVVVCLDSYIQPKRGEIGCSHNERAVESLRAAILIGHLVTRLGLPDDEPLEDLRASLREYLGGSFYTDPTHFDKVYIPAYHDGGNIHHNLVAEVTREVFPNAIQYPTYISTDLMVKGNIEIVPTQEEIELKNKALACHKSQVRINRPHFEAVYGKSEWLM